MKNDTTVVLCAGLNRSGSTWQWNAVRALMQAALPHISPYAAWIKDYDATNPAKVHLVKIHRQSDAVNLSPDIVVSTYRDLRAVAGSLVRMGWATTEWRRIQVHLDAYVANAAYWEARADLVTPYEKLLDRPLEVIGELARTIGVPLAPDRLAAALAVVENLTPAATVPTGNLASADKETFLHDGHIGDRTDEAAASRLPGPLLASIETRYRDWLIAHGYAPAIEHVAARSC